ncbi:HGxxPAAW family protein [Isoptericola sp. b441]|uniref:HGxxPAAW family protein n=1 Tax=Actinotalea lenta TaxID=3064654 RepID=A0ABT9DBA8_9CELL|nr:MULTISPECIES: HGxxPAAW family protein [unclassified Isoptericola]MDO8107574.1 HGxxPAAW family protein [Isoptericola sp. b441]MDO8120766.1 HGxxPAAW family protein [Isoptericola sp. b490]
MTETSGERAHLPPKPPHANHGSTPAAWVTVTVVMLGGLVAALAVAFSLVWLFWVGLGVIVLGVVVGRILRMLGLGQPANPVDGAGPGA